MLAHFTLCFDIEMTPTLAGVKLDLTTRLFETASETLARMPVIPPHPKSIDSGGQSRMSSAMKSRGTSATSSQKVKTPATVKTYEMPLQPLVRMILVSI